MAKTPRRWLVLDDPDFEIIWQRLKDGDQDAWRDLMCDVLPLLKRWLRAANVPEADRADLRQEILLAVVKKTRSAASGQPPRAFIGWLSRVVRHVVADWWQDHRRENITIADLDRWTLPDAETAPEHETKAMRKLRQAEEQVRSAFRESTWQAFWQTYAEGRPIEDVAARLGMSVNAVYQARAHVLKRLRRACTD